MTILNAFGRLALACACPGALAAQLMACPAGIAAPYFGWDGTDCGQCNVYDSYLEYLVPPVIRDIRPNGPAAGRLREQDMILAVDSLTITTPAAWHRMRDAEPGRPLRFTVRRGSDTVSTTVVPSTRCVPRSRSAPPPAVILGPRGRPMGAPRSFVVGGAVVELWGSPDSVSYDPTTGETTIFSARTIVHVKAKVP